jgi:hypothetical protein
MRKLSNKSLVAQVLMVFLLLSASVFGTPPNNNKGKTNQAKPRISKKLETNKAVKSLKTGKLEVDQAQLLLDNGISRLTASLECS